jgi:hypothetical protein
MLFIAKERIGKKGYGCKWIRASIEIYTETRIKEQMKNKIYNTVWTIPKYTTLSEQF